jgi:hypothetical protein
MTIIDRRKLARPSLLAVGALVAGLTLTCMQRAYAAVLVPNTTEITLFAPAAGVSVGVPFPILNSPVKIATSCISGRRGTASIHATLHPASAAGAMAVTYSGTNAFPGAAVGGITAAVGTDLMGLDLVNNVRLELGPAINQVRVQNLNAFPVQVAVEQTW